MADDYLEKMIPPSIHTQAVKSPRFYPD